MDAYQRKQRFGALHANSRSSRRHCEDISASSHSHNKIVNLADNTTQSYVQSSKSRNDGNEGFLALSQKTGTSDMSQRKDVEAA